MPPRDDCDILLFGTIQMRLEIAMPPELTTLYAFTLALCEALMEDISQDEMDEQPAACVNTPTWILGHLAICTDFALMFLDQPMRLPKSWHAAYGPGSLPTKPHDRGPDAPSPTRQELLTALRTGHAAVTAALPFADAKSLAEPNPLPMPFLQRTLPTKRDLLAHLLSTHEAAHLGHLSNWRRQMSRPPLF